MSSSTATRRSAHRDSRRSCLSTSSTSSTMSSVDENNFPITMIDVVANISIYVSEEKENFDPDHGKNVAVPNKSKRSKRARSSSSLSPSKKSSPSQTVKDSAFRRMKKALTSRKAPSAEAIEVDVPVPVLMDATEAYTGFAYSGTHFEAPSDTENPFPVAAIDIVADIALFVRDEEENISRNDRKNVAAPNKSKRSKRARSSSSFTPSKKSSSSQIVKDAASRRTKKAASLCKAPSAKAIEVGIPVPVLMDATEPYTGFAYSGVHSQLPPVFADNTVPAIADFFFDSFA